ncbi:hypothetical protein F66182_6973 [Fusarium sp. NRRL 66182]|nr:hypothetical protein F66182_6973 [Fusarium sp. NRRL 66182]
MASHLRSFAPAFGEVEVDQVTESRISNVVAMLPTSLQSGPIRFLKRSISTYVLHPDLTISRPPSKPLPLSEDGVPASVTQPMSRVLYSESPEHEPAVRAASGVHWKFARQGTNLVNISIDGGKAALAEEDVAFERKAFVDGVTYLLRALPRDLDECELRRIQDALPDQVNQSNTSLTRVDPGAGRITPSQPRSIIHRGVQMAVVNFIFLLSFVTPFVLGLVRSAAQLERRYKVSERLVGHGLGLVSSIGKQSASLTETIGQMNDGKVAQALTEVFVWTLDGVTQGISDGLGEGLSIVGSKSKRVR